MRETASKAYSEILKTLRKYKDVCVFDIDELDRKAKCHLFGLKLKEEYGFDIDPKTISSLEWVRLREYITLGLWGEKYHRTISWSDDGSQPDGELLLEIRFSTGAYIFGDDYPTNLFQKFFLELKSYNPNYTDTANHNLYFSMDNAGKIFNEFNSILKKYYELNKEDFKQRRIIKMKEELEKLEKI